MYTTKAKIQWLWKNMEGYHLLYLAGIGGTILYNFMQLVVPFFSQQIVDQFLTGEDALYNLEYHRDILIRLIIMMIGFTFLRTVLTYFTCMGYEKVSQAAMFRLRNTLFEKIEHQDMVFYDTYRTGDLMTRLTGDLDAVRHMIAWVVRMVIEAFSLVIATSIYFLVMDWKLALCLLAIAPVIFGIIILFKNKVAPMHRSLREKLAMMNTTAQENIAGNRVVKAFAREDYEIAKFDERNRDYAETNKKTAYVWLHYFPYVETMANLMPVVLLLVGGIFLIKDQITMGQYVAFAGLNWAIANPMRQLGNIMNEFQRFSAASSKVMELYFSEPAIVDDKKAIESTERFEGRVEFRNVSFSYGSKEVLSDISFTILPGQTVAIMGETGCGKTTLIQLIPRFYDCNSGSVLVDGTDVRKIKLSTLRKNIGMATQDVLLFSDTIDGNIAYGDSSMSEEAVRSFAKSAAADEFIDKMPEGYDTIVGERGVGLSGGQKQRISLARALAIRPSILILDDTTSAVDLETEKYIQQSLENLDFTCTKIIIAQRISSTKNADQILVLQDGRITECGTHAELLAKKGYYYEVAKLQNGGEDFDGRE